MMVIRNRVLFFVGFLLALFSCKSFAKDSVNNNEKVILGFLNNIKINNPAFALEILKGKENFDEVVFARDFKTLNKVLDLYSIPERDKWKYENIVGTKGLQTINIFFFDKPDTQLELKNCSIEILYDNSKNRIINYLVKYELFIEQSNLPKLKLATEPND